MSIKEIDDEVIDRPDISNKKSTKVRKPHMWNVVLLNDDYTPIDFVVLVLEKIFHKSHDDAISLMIEIHQKGKGIAGTYTFEVAETKVYETMHMARSEEHPLMAVVEEV